MNHSLLLQVAALLFLVSTSCAIVISERAQTARGRLLQALLSPSGKLTLSPEIIIPDPSDPTAVLLQSSLITSLSTKIRTQAKANAAFISGGIPAMKTFCNEQEVARGNFPGPVPVIFCDQGQDMSEIAEAGAEGVLVAVCGGNEISSIDDLTSDSAWSNYCRSALEHGLQPIPEITIGEATAESWQSKEIETLASKITEIIGETPVSILMTVNRANAVVDEDTENAEEPDTKLPLVPKGLGKKVPILGSVKAKAGGGRIGVETARYKSAGFTGAVLRQDCIPVVSMSQDLEYLASFWSACIGDLKSTKSKTFNFRSKNNMEKDLGLQWARYQMDVVESGALGETPSMPSGLDPDAGDYQGF